MAFPTVALLDSFKRGEDPLSNESKWKPITILSSKTGECNGAEWETHEITFEGAYWSPEEFTNPGVTTSFNRSTEISVSCKFNWYVCVSNPASSEFSAYCLKAQREGSVEFELKLEKIVENTNTVLATLKKVELLGTSSSATTDKVGLSAQTGKVIAWRKKGAGAWEELLSASDSTFTKGYVAFGGELQAGAQVNFEAGGSEESESPTVEKPSTQNGKVGHSASLQIKATNTTKYKATPLPKGLSINEGTGKITGEFETAETVKTKVIVENAKAETAETEFEWVITEGGSTNVLGMIVG